MAFPLNYGDPQYSALARTVEQQLGLPSGILDAIRTQGERSNANQVSPAGARTPYQFIPATRQGMISNYGTDPWKDAPSATLAAGQLLNEDYQRSGSWDKAVAMYHGGPNPSNWGPRTRAYASRVGSFDVGGNAVAAGNSLYPVVNGVDPLAPERPTAPVPVDGSAAPSASVAATAPVAAKKRGGILGALGSIFMPAPDSRWAAALRGGLFDAQANQQLYKQQQNMNALSTMEATAKLKNLLTKGEYQVVGNSVFHVRPDGTTEMISSPSTLDDKVKLIDQWKTMDDANPAKAMVASLILGAANMPATVAARNAEAEKIARIRAGATTGAATIRANTVPKVPTLPPLPPGFSVVK